MPRMRTITSHSFFMILAVIMFGLPPAMAQSATPVVLTVQEELLSAPLFADESKPLPSQLEPAKNAYQAGDLKSAIEETQRALNAQPKGDAHETAVFLLGDLHAKFAESVKPAETAKPVDIEKYAHLKAAVSAYQKALQLYPKSGYAPRAILKLGRAYDGLGFYYESIATYKRLTTKRPGSVFTPLALLGTGQAYTKLQRWPEAANAYEQAIAATDSTAVRLPSIYGLADALYHLGQFDRAFAAYHTLESTDPEELRQDTSSLFQYGDAAYQIHRFKQAQAIFSILYNIHPDDSRASVALARAAEALQQNGSPVKAEGLSSHLISQYPGSSGEEMLRIVRLAESIGSTEECTTVIPFAQPILCQPRPSTAQPQNPQQIIALKKEASELLQKKQMQPILSPVLQDLSDRLKTVGEYETSLEVLSWLRRQAGSERERGRATALIRTRLAETIDAWQGNPDHDLNIVRLFYLYSSAFTPEMLTGKTGLAVAVSHARLELYSQAVELYEPIASGNAPTLAEEALSGLGSALLHKKEFPKAQRTFEQFLQRYPNSPHAHEAQRQLAQAFIGQDQPDRAIPLLTDWLTHHQNHPDSQQVSLQLAEAYRRTGRYQDEIALYRKWLRPDQPAVAGLALRLADALFQAHDYRHAADFYQALLRQDGAGEESDWVRLQLARSLKAAGRKNQADEILSSLASQGQNDVIRELADRMAHPL